MKYLQQIPLSHGVPEQADLHLLYYDQDTQLEQLLNSLGVEVSESYLKRKLEASCDCFVMRSQGRGQQIVAIQVKAEHSDLNKYSLAHRFDKLDLGSIHHIAVLADEQADFESMPYELYIEQSLIGLSIQQHDGRLYKTDKTDKTTELAIHYSDERMKACLELASAKRSSILSIIDLVDAPSNRKTTLEMEAWLRASSERHGYSLRVMDMAELQKEGFHALLAVNRGSEVPAKCLIAEYRTASDAAHVVLVGKGVTFDTGGVSIKGGNNMHYMKSDMGGAAAVMGTIDLVASTQLPINLTVIVPTTDNSVGTRAIKPGDVIESYSGKTIEVINTDAEGRLILADGLAYAQKHYPSDYLIDLATLTGSVVRSLGFQTSGLMTHNDALAKSLMDIGYHIGERTWRLPAWSEYGKHMESDIADIKNLSAAPVAGAITAGKFLEYFVGEHDAWAHLDIAAMAFAKMPGHKDKSGTGYGIDLLYTWMSSLTKS